MGKIKKILENELVGGTQGTDVYPVTSTKAVYDTNNKVLDDYIQHLKKTSTFAGIATPTTNPGTPDGPVFYIAGEGTYANFSNIVIEAGQLGILKWNGTWSKEVLEIGAGGGSGGNANAMYQNARGIGYMALAMKIYKSDGEVELDDKEFNLLKDFGQGFPLFYQDALGLLEEEKK